MRSVHVDEYRNQVGYYILHLIVSMHRIWACNSKCPRTHLALISYRRRTATNQSGNSMNCPAGHSGK